MARKTKQIAKEPKEDQVPASNKKEKTISSDWDIFTDTFKERLSQFIGLNKEVLDIQSAVEGTDQSDQIDTRRERMATKVEEAATEILRNELTSLQEWIRQQQESLDKDIKKIQTVYQENRNRLVELGAFSEDQIKDQLMSVQKKAQEKRESYDNYESLLARSKEIYS